MDASGTRVRQRKHAPVLVGIKLMAVEAKNFDIFGHIAEFFGGGPPFMHIS